MSRIDRERLLTGELPCVVEIATRFGDADLQGHINNVATVALLQEGRIAFNRRAGLSELTGGFGTMVAALSVEYAEQLSWMSPVASHVGVIAIGRTSYTIGQVLRQDGRAGTFAETTLVLTGKGGSTPLPDSFRANLERDRIAAVPRAADQPTA